MNLIAYDKHVNDAVRNRAKESNSMLVPSPSGLSKRAELIFSLVTAGTALEAARQFSVILTSKQIYVDFNSVSPKLKAKIGNVFREKAVPMVDAAVMGAIPGNGLGVSILLSQASS